MGASLWLYAFDTGQGPMVDYFQHSNKFSGSVSCFMRLALLYCVEQCHRYLVRDNPTLISPPTNQSSVTDFVQVKHVQVGKDSLPPLPTLLQLAKRYVLMSIRFVMPLNTNMVK
jgi:hypothetical protein